MEASSGLALIDFAALGKHFHRHVLHLTTSSLRKRRAKHSVKLRLLFQGKQQVASFPAIIIIPEHILHHGAVQDRLLVHICLPSSLVHLCQRIL